jgi:DNA-binding transcriptional LysR family regulator
MEAFLQLSDRIGRRLKLHDVHVLMAVVQSGSMSRAAALLNTGQPAISRSIADLEQALGVRLLERNRDGVKPTEYGRAVLDGGTKVFDDLRQTVKDIEFLADPTVGEVAIGGNPFLIATFIATVVDQLSSLYPRMVFRLAPGNVQALHRELVERNVEVLVTRRFGPIADENLHFEPLFEDSYSVVVGAQHPLAQRRKVELAELMCEPWVLPPPDGPLGAIAMRAFRASGLDYPHTAVIGPAEVRASLLAGGRFISIVPNSGLRFSRRQLGLTVLPVRAPFDSVPVGIVTLKKRAVSPVARLFIDSCRALAQQSATEPAAQRGMPRTRRRPGRGVRQAAASRA